MKRSLPRASGTPYLLLLVRHGQAVPKTVGLTDFERVLTPEGTRECQDVAKRLAKRCVQVDFMSSSPADRALETAHVFAREFRYPVHRIHISNQLYSARTARPLVASIRKLSDTIHTSALVGHNPLLDEIAAYYVSDFRGTIPKGGTVAISFAIRSWTDALRGTGKLHTFLNPSPVSTGAKQSTDRCLLTRSRS